MTRYARPTIRDGQLRAKPITLRQLNQEKQREQHVRREEAERQKLIQVMYGHDDLYREYLEAQRMEMEINQMRASCGLPPLADGWANPEAVQEMADDARAQRQEDAEHVEAMAVRQMRRKKA